MHRYPSLGGAWGRYSIAYHSTPLFDQTGSHSLLLGSCKSISPSPGNHLGLFLLSLHPGPRAWLWGDECNKLRLRIISDLLDPNPPTQMPLRIPTAFFVANSPIAIQIFSETWADFYQWQVEHRHTSIGCSWTSVQTYTSCTSLYSICWSEGCPRHYCLTQKAFLVAQTHA